MFIEDDKDKHFRGIGQIGRKVFYLLDLLRDFLILFQIKLGRIKLLRQLQGIYFMLKTIKQTFK
ncbi:MAG: hypothetical protein A3H98_13095 [Bacteroidetes bacterium RIFCSPLOWO2_02_FULL_36_8]|nr:MAG: hypothetical protein A3H98_13095 [Bacteroidetes bacterium RIFCSPLOWO2_02_FULL_36_8]OFY68757.1 MAG: hypothetical protein A3G23_02900 [Bacteroidetes bacterium RIFCSPLOWO2_12_FULL_37_12]